MKGGKFDQEGGDEVGVRKGGRCFFRGGKNDGRLGRWGGGFHLGALRGLVPGLELAQVPFNRVRARRVHAL